MTGVNTLPLLESSNRNHEYDKPFTPFSGDNGSSCVFHSSSHVAKLMENLSEHRKDGVFCDVEFVCDQTTVKAHKVILSASSPYFKAMFSAGLKEQEQTTIQLQLISGPIFTDLIEFIYTGKINVAEHNVQELLVAADMLQLSQVVSLCTKFLKQKLHARNAVGVYMFSDRHNCTELKFAATHFIQLNFPSVTREEEFFNFPLDHLLKFLRSEELRIDSELQVFNAAMGWITHDLESRRCHVFEVLRNVRLPLLSTYVLDEAIRTNDDENLRLALCSIRRDLFIKAGNFVPLNAHPRLRAKKDIFVFGGSRRELINSWAELSGNIIYRTVARFDTFKRQWHEATSMTTSRVLPGVTSLEGYIFVVGGEEESQILATGECYDPLRGTWTRISNMIVPRCEFGLCAVDGLLYAIGGWIGEDIGDTIEVYDPVLNQWRGEGHLPEPLFSMGVVAYEGLIYIVGGCTHSRRHLQDLKSYNPVTKTWSFLSPMTVPRSQMGVSVLEKHLYVVGGTNRRHQVLYSVEKYSFDEDKWTTVSQMNTPRTCPAVAAADGLLYVIGGMQTHEVNFWRTQITISSVECYDPVCDVWKVCPPIPSTRGEAGAVVF